MPAIQEDHPEASRTIEILSSVTRGEVQLSKSTEWLDRPSLVWKFDAFLLGVEIRWAKRAYVYETIGELNRQIGFVNLRPLRELSFLDDCIGRFTDPVAEAFLAIPTHFNVPSVQIAIASDYGEFYGERLPSPVTVYCRPARLFGGMCIQACVVMCQIMLTRLGFRVLGPHEQTYLANVLGKQPQGDLKSFDAFTGLSLRDAWAILRHPVAHGNAVLEVHDLANPEKMPPPGEAPLPLEALESNDVNFNPVAIEMAAYIISQYLALGLPVILAVDYAQLCPDRAAPLKEQVKKDYLPHAILLIGAQYVGAHQRAERFIFHDPAYKPYTDKSADLLLRIAANQKEGGDATPNQQRKWGKVSLLVPLPQGVKCGLQSLWLAVERFRNALRLRQAATIPRIAISNTSSLSQEEYENECYQLVPVADALQFYVKPDRIPPELKLFLAEASHSREAPAFLWAVERYDGPRGLLAMADQEPDAVWFFDASLPSLVDAPAYGSLGMLDSRGFMWWEEGRMLEPQPQSLAMPYRSRKATAVL